MSTQDSDIGTLFYLLFLLTTMLAEKYFKWCNVIYFATLFRHFILSFQNHDRLLRTLIIYVVKNKNRSFAKHLNIRDSKLLALQTIFFFIDFVLFFCLNFESLESKHKVSNSRDFWTSRVSRRPEYSHTLERSTII